MPSVLSPNQKSYAPLADEVNPPFGNIAPAPAVTRNGTIVYSKRYPSSTSNSSSTDSDDLERVGAQLRNDSEETLSPSFRRKGKARATGERPFAQDSGDIGEVGRGPNNGRERAWDIEQGPGAAIMEEEQGQYPPNLAKFAAKDAARRRAARESRLMQAAPTSPRSSSSTTSYSRRPFSVVSTSSKRNSIMGLVEGLWPGSPKQRNDGWAEGELPTVNAANGQSAPYTNPYDPQPAFSPLPAMAASPTSPQRPSPFADPPAPAPVAGSSAPRRPPSSVSSTSGNGQLQSPLASPTDGIGFAYSGPTWRGGQAAQQVEEDEDKPQGGEKWWHALCAWGKDLDGGHEANSRGNQAGRTNPFE